MTNAQAAGYVADGFEIAIHLNGRRRLQQRDARARSAGSLHPADPFATSTRACPLRRRTERTASPGATGSTSQASSSANGIRLDTNYYHYPARGSAAPGCPDRLGHAHALRGPGRDADRHLPGAHAADRRDRPVLPVPRSTPCSTTPSAPGVLRVFTANMHTDHRRAPRLRRHRRLGAGSQRPHHHREADADLGRRPKRLLLPGVRWNGNALGFRITPGAGANGLQAMLPTQARAGTLTGSPGAGARSRSRRRRSRASSTRSSRPRTAQYSATYGP